MRLFVAVWPPESVVAALRGLERPAVRGVRWTTPEQWHVTLRFFGTVDDPTPMVSALASVATESELPPVRVGPKTGCFGRTVLHVPCDGLTALATRVVEATREFGERPDERTFNGHITLARARRGGDVRPLRGTDVSAEFVATEVTLVRSTTDQGGARYEVIERFALG